MRIDLNGNWQFRATDESDFKEAVVPGCNYLDLLRLNLIPDPFVGTNEKDVQWVADKEWNYKKTFTVDADLLACDAVYLHAKQLDTLCLIVINGNQVGESINCHTELSLKLDKSTLVIGENVLEFQFASAVNFAACTNAMIKATPNANGLRGITFLRKPQCHFGWDWGPVLPLSGITGDVYIEGINTARLNDLKITQFHHYDGAVTLTLNSAVEKYDDKDISVIYSVKTPDGDELNARGVDVGDGNYQAEIVVEHPQLWWTRELSDTPQQPLYEVIASVMCADDVVSGAIKKIGLRTIKLIREKDDFGQNFCFELNGIKIFAKGANLIPPDSFMTRFNKSDWDKLLNAAVFANMNMLRVWGGGYYGDDYLYDECDKLGILVWQDFAFACQGYPFFIPDFSDNATAEAAYQIKRLRHHASLAVWCGNNEIESMSVGWALMTKYIEWAKTYFYDVLPKTLKSLDDRDYIPGSPCGLAYLYGFDADNVGDTHLWAVWHGLQPLKYYRKRMTRFCSEYGFESLPDIKTIKTFAEDKDLSLTSKVMTAHQKCSGGNGKLRYYIASRFNLPDKFSDYIYLSQVMQAECIRDAAEHWRRNKGRCNGALYWQLNDCWPTVSWSGVDYCGRYKALEYSAKRFFKPINVSIEDSDGGFYVYTVNDTKNDYKAQLTFKVCKYDGEVLVEKNLDVDIAAGESKRQLGIGMAIVRIKERNLRCYAVATITSDDVEIGRATVLLHKEKFAKLPVPTITKSMEFEDDGILKITLVSDKYARFVQLKNDITDSPFSDNFFDLLPNEPKVIYQNLGKVCPLNALDGAISVFSAAELSKKGNWFTDILAAATVYYRPVNFFSHLYSKRVPRDIKKKLIADYEKMINDEDKES